jgi:hypothetical protein
VGRYTPHLTLVIRKDRELVDACAASLQVLLLP